MTVMKKHYSKCSVFAFGFETCIKTILPLISRLISEVLLVADHVSIKCCFSSLTSLSVLVHWRGFMQPGVKVNGTYYCDVLLLKQLLPDICQAAGDF